MNKNLREIFSVIANDFVFSQIIVFQLTICFAICIFSDCFKCYSESGNIKFEDRYISSNQYQLTNRFIGDEAKYLYTEDSLNKLMLFYNRLISSDKFNYISVNDQPVYIKDFKGSEIFCYGYEFDSINNTDDLSAVKTLWCDSSIFNSYDLKISVGKSFNETDGLNSENGYTSVVLGYKYAEFYKIGDTIDSISVLADTNSKKLKVTGFLNKNSTVSYKSNFINLDYYILIPFDKTFKIPSSETERKNLIRKYIMLTGGEIVCSESAENIQTYISQLCNELKIEPAYVIVGAKNQMAKYMHTDIIEFNNLLKIISITLIIFSCLLMILFLFISIKHNLKNYSVLLISGFNYGDIMKIITGQSILYQFESLIFSICISLTICILNDIPFRLHSVILVLLVSSAISISSSLIAYINFSNYDTSEYIRKR